MDHIDTREGCTRRTVLIASAARVAAAAQALASDAAQDMAAPADTSGHVSVRLEVNGQPARWSLIRASLLDALREHLHLTGRKRDAITGSAARAP